jgi:hypothetical protein
MLNQSTKWRIFSTLRTNHHRHGAFADVYAAVLPCLREATTRFGGPRQQSGGGPSTGSSASISAGAWPTGTADAATIVAIGQVFVTLSKRIIYYNTKLKCNFL